MTVIKLRDLENLHVMNWAKLKERTWNNKALIGDWWCHIETAGYNEFWIGFDKLDGEVRYHFTSYDGMCGYNFKEFGEDIENKWDREIQEKCLRYLGELLDDGIIQIKKA